MVLPVRLPPHNLIFLCHRHTYLGSISTFAIISLSSFSLCSTGPDLGFSLGLDLTSCFIASRMPRHFYLPTVDFNAKKLYTSFSYNFVFFSHYSRIPTRYREHDESTQGTEAHLFSNIRLAILYPVGKFNV